MTFPAFLSHENGEFQVDEQLNMSQSWPESLSSQGIMQTHQVKRGGACCLLFMIPVQLKLRKLDPEAVEKFKENIVRVNQSVPFGKMTPNASEMILVNFLIGTVAKGYVLQMQMKDFNITSASSRSTYNSTYTSALHPIPCVTNTTVSQVHLTNTANDTDIVVDMSTNQFQDQPLSLGESTSVLQPKPCDTNTILSQVNSTNTVNNTDTLTDLNLNTNHLIDQPFSLDQIHDRCSVIKKNLFLEDKEIKKKTRPEDSLTTRSGLVIDLEE